MRSCAVPVFPPVLPPELQLDPALVLPPAAAPPEEVTELFPPQAELPHAERSVSNAPTKHTERNRRALLIILPCRDDCARSDSVVSCCCRRTGLKPRIRQCAYSSSLEGLETTAIERMLGHDGKRGNVTHVFDNW